MNADDLKKIIGSSGESVEYAPIALLLSSGYACFGHYNAKLNKDFSETLVILNAQLTDMNAKQSRSRPAVEDFREFLLEIVAADDDQKIEEISTRGDYGKTIPLIAVSMSEISIVYPVSQIVELLGRVGDDKAKAVPRLFDLERSEILALLRTELW